MNSTHPLKLAKARTHLLLKSPFFGQLALKCEFREQGNTMATDGSYLYYNRDFVENTTDRDLIGVLSHEILHIAFMHSYRRNGRDPRKWNIACDYAINAILIEEYNIPLPEDRLYEPKYSGLHAEKIYSLLQKEGEEEEGEEEEEEGCGLFSESGSDWGEVLDAKDNVAGSTSEQETEWVIAITQATSMSKKAGDLPAIMQRQIEDTKAKVSWQELLRSFTLSNTPDDYNWYPPNLQYLHQGLHVPSMTGYKMGPIVIGVDTSGSIDLPLLARFFAELSAILETCKPEKIYVLYCDTKITHVDEVDEYDLPLKPNCKGGGGTRFEPVFNYVEEKDIQPEWIIYFTDMRADFPKKPAYPVLWARSTTINPPYGSVIDLE